MRRTNTGRPWSHVESHRGVEGADKHDTRDHGHVHDQLTILHVYASTSRARRASPAPPTARGTARAARPPEAAKLPHVANISTANQAAVSRRRPNHPQRRKLAHATRLVWGHVKCAV